MYNFFRYSLPSLTRELNVGWESPYVNDNVLTLNSSVGTILMDRLERYIKETIAPGWAVSLELISTKEAVLFYQKKGFEERPCEWDGPGMFKMVCSE